MEVTREDDALLVAVATGDTRLVEGLLALGADVNGPPSRRQLPLVRAAAFGHLAVVQQLVEAGAPLELRDALGWTPLQAAAQLGRLDVLEYLLQKGAGVEPLHALNPATREPWLDRMSEPVRTVIERYVKAGFVIPVTPAPQEELARPVRRGSPPPSGGTPEPRAAPDPYAVPDSSSAATAAPAGARTSAPPPDPVVESVLPAPRSLWRRLPANVLGGLATAAFLLDPRRVLAGDNDDCLIVAGLAVVVGAFARWTEHRWPPAGSGGRLARGLDVGYRGAVGVLAVTLITRLPVIGPRLALQDHRWVEGYPYHRGGLGLAKNHHLHSADLGPILLYDRELIASRIRELGENERFRDDHPYWALLFAARRLQGMSLDEIARDPRGLELLAGAMLAERHPPCYTKDVTWITTRLGSAPGPHGGPGFLDPGKARDPIRAAMRVPATLHEDTLEGLLLLAQESPGLFAADQVEALLQAWLAVKKSDPAGIRRTIEVAHDLSVRLAPLVRDGAVPVELVLPEEFRPEVRQAYEQAVAGLFSMAGLRSVPAPGGAHVEVAVRFVRFEDLPYESYTYEVKDIEEKVSVPTYVGGGRPVSYRTQSRHRTDYVKHSTEGHGPVEVPVPVISVTAPGVASVSYEPIPIGRVPMNRVGDYRNPETHKPDVDSTTRIFMDYFLKDFCLLPWRAGVTPLPEDPSSYPCWD